MIISIATLFPKLYEAFLETSLLSHAQQKNLVSFGLHSLFDFSKAGSRIDSPSFGHGAGMVIKPEIVDKAIEDIESKHGKAYKIFFSPHGTKLNQDVLHKVYNRIDQAQKENKHILLIPARYEGMDSRVEQFYADEILSLGDMVLMGGDLPAMAFIESFLRLIPGVVGKQESVENDSFTGAFVDFPEYTKPVVWKGLEVPEVIRSGDHAKMDAWRQEESAKRTLSNHFDWLRSHVKSKHDKSLVKRFLQSHYVILMHDNVMLEDDKVGTSSVTSLDIHDIARSAFSFGLKGYYIVTPLADQQKIVDTLLGFWRSDRGEHYNKNRKKALEIVKLVSSIDEAIEDIISKEQNNPILLGTAAKEHEHKSFISYNDQETVWTHKKPVVFILGTARGLSNDIINRCDYLLEPIEGFTDFNHLSVRSAAAIIFDRWLGINSSSRNKQKEIKEK